MKVKVCDICKKSGGVKSYYLYLYQGAGKTSSGNRKVARSTYLRQTRLGEFCPEHAKKTASLVSDMVDSVLLALHVPLSV